MQQQYSFFFFCTYVVYVWTVLFKENFHVVHTFNNYIETGPVIHTQPTQNLKLLVPQSQSIGNFFW